VFGRVSFIDYRVLGIYSPTGSSAGYLGQRGLNVNAPLPDSRYPRTILFTFYAMRSKINNDTIAPAHIIRNSRSEQRWTYVSNPSRPDIAYGPGTLPRTVTLVTWNINGAPRKCRERTEGVISYIQREAFACHASEAPRPAVLMLQEVTRESFNVLLGHAWIRAHFRVVPASPDQWPHGAHYGVVTLLSNSIPIAYSASVEYHQTQHGRTALLTDILVGGAEPRARILRIINTHLESNMQGTSMRRAQMRAAAWWLRDTHIFGGVLCGDMNAITPSDKTFVKENGLEDAWHELISTAPGYTWGFQPPSLYLPPGRLDKILFVRRRGYEVGTPWQLGSQVRLADGAYLSDHCGLIAWLKM